MSPKKALLLSALVLAASLILTCSRDDTIYNPSENEGPVRCAAFLAAALPPYGTPVDTSLLSIIDTFRTFDTVFLIGLTYPPDANVSARWDFGDNGGADGKTARRAYAAGGTYRAVFTISDAAGVSISDTVTAAINTPPIAPVLLDPDSGLNDLDPVGQPRFRWSGGDADHDALTYTLRIDTLNPPLLSYPAASDTEFTLAASVLVKLRSYYWCVKAQDPFGDSALSPVWSFRTRDPSASSDTGSLSGIVLRQGGVPSWGIRVTLLRNNIPDASTLTDSTGAWQLKYLAVGPVIMVFSDSIFFMADSAWDTVRGGQNSVIPLVTLQDNCPPFIMRSADAVIKSGSTVTLHMAARDTMYSVDSLLTDLSGSWLPVTAADTAVTFTGGGDHIIRIRAVDIHGNASLDSITIHVNFPPDIPALRAPSSGEQVQWSVPYIFSWDCADADNPAGLRYDIFIGTARPFQDSDRVASGLDVKSFQWPTGYLTKPFFWKVLAFDGIDTVESVTDSFFVGDYQIGRITGVARLEGVRRHNGIRITLQGDSNSYVSFTDDSGFCAFQVSPGTYSVTAEDTLRKAFETAVKTGLTVSSGDSASFDTLILQDIHAPRITCSYPAPQGTIIKNLALSRNLTVTGTFTDSGSQVHVDSVRATLNGVPVTGLTRTSFTWQFTAAGIADGHYTVRVNAADSAGNPAQELVWSFSVNSKTINARVSLWHDTLYCTASVANIRPNLRAWYFNYDKHATPAWNDSVKPANPSIVKPWPLPHPPVYATDTCIVMAVDDSGMAVYDTVRYSVTNDLPVASAGNDTVVPMNASFIYVTLHGTYTQRSGHAARFDWSINSGSFLRTSVGDTVIQLSSSYHPGIPCVLRVTDDKGYADQDTILVAVGRDWVPVGSANIATVNDEAALGVFSDNEMYLAFSDPANLNKIKVLRWNGSAWSTAGSGFSTGNASMIQVAVGTGFGYGGATYSVPYVALCDGGSPLKVKVFKPDGSVVGTASRIDGQYGLFRMTVVTGYMDGTPYLGFGDNLAGDVVKVKKYVFNMNPYDWDSVGTTASTSSSRVREIAFDGSVAYLLVRSSSADTLKRLNGTAWQTVNVLATANNPAILLQSGTLYCADRDNAAANQLTVKRLSGTSWIQVGAALTGSPYGVNNYDNTGSLGAAGLQHTGSYLCAAYKEWDEGGVGDTLRVKAFDGARWNPVGLSGLPTARVGFNRAAFVAKNGRLYLAYRNNSDNRVTVLMLR